jgi:D-alanyl-D-alanine carboxypeptidase
VNQRRYALALLALLGLFVGSNLGAVLDGVVGTPIDPGVIRAFRECPTCAGVAPAIAAAALASNQWLLAGAGAGLGLGILAYGLRRPRPAGSLQAGRPASGGRLRWGLYLLVAVAVAGLLLRAAARTAAVAQPAATATPAPTLTLVPLPAAAITLISTTSPPPAPLGTNTPAPTPLATQPVSIPETPTPAHTPICADTSGLPGGLLTRVDRDTALERDFEPDDLAEVPLAPGNLVYQAISLRVVVHPPLLDLVSTMNEAGLNIVVVSGYRSYTEQVLAHEKWQTLYPDRAPEISALPGHSEHQLGTAVDFSTPSMNRLYGETFNVNFSKTAEGQWLIQNAPAYGFALSYPAWATEATGYAWEPWHFRYVGSLALELTTRNLSLTQYLRQCPAAE